MISVLARTVILVTAILCPGGGVLPVMANTGRLHPKEVPFFKLHVYEGAGFYELNYI